MISPRFGRLPEGVRDLLPAAARCKRQLEQTFADLVASWGYLEVATPTFEYFENLIATNNIDDQLYKFLNRRGHLMALKPDTTRSIARMVATRMRNAALPLRLYYLAHAFRYEELLAGRQREIYQAGVEMLGSAGPVADAEIIVLAVEAMQACGLSDFRISLGHVGIFNSLMTELELPAAQVRAIKAAVSNKDFVCLGEQLAAKDLPAEKRQRVTRLLSLRGDVEILTAAAGVLTSKEALTALKNLDLIYRTLQNHGIEQYITIDLGLLPGLDYYTGMVFEGYTLALGVPVCSGGRYDDLIANFGYDLPATGFAMSINQLLTLYERQQLPSTAQCPVAELQTDVLVAWAADHLEIAVRKAQELRTSGLRVKLAPEANTYEQALQNSRQQNVKELIYIKSTLGNSKKVPNTPSP